MNKKNYEHFATAMIGLGELYNRKISPQLIQMYWRAFNKFDYSAVSMAVQKHYSDPDKSSFFPKPGDIIYWIEGSVDDQALVAWYKVDRAIRDHGPYSSVVFDDEVIHRVVEQMGGWVNLCLQKNEQSLAFLSPRFLKMYKGFRNTTVYPAKLCGITDGKNYGNINTNKPIFIGDKSKAAAVLLNGRSYNRSGVSRSKQDEFTETLQNIASVAKGHRKR